MQAQGVEWDPVQPLSVYLLAGGVGVTLLIFGALTHHWFILLGGLFLVVMALVSFLRRPKSEVE